MTWFQEKLTRFLKLQLSIYCFIVVLCRVISKETPHFIWLFWFTDNKKQCLSEKNIKPYSKLLRFVRDVANFCQKLKFIAIDYQNGLLELKKLSQVARIFND